MAAWLRVTKQIMFALFSMLPDCTKDAMMNRFKYQFWIKRKLQAMTMNLQINPPQKSIGVLDHFIAEPFEPIKYNVIME